MDLKGPPRGHSCKRCKERKIKCDGRQPCSSCSRAEVTCLARPPAMPRRARRKVQSVSPSKERRHAQLQTLDATDEYLINGEQGHPRYFNHPLWEDLLKELPIVASSQYTSERTVKSPVAAGILWGISGYMSLRKFHPSAVQIFQLWQIFLNNVQLLTKILHATSIQKQISTITADLDQISRELEALLFSIYLAAVNSISDSECQSVLKEKKAVVQRVFITATQQALVNAECLKSCSLVVLQALTLYLLSMQQHHDHQSAWLLTSLAVRSGQRMGLHKSTITRNIPPFESDLRLRLWWQIIILDCKAAKLSGFADIKIDSHFISQLPLNINDANLYPEMTELPTEIVSHSTEMALCLVTYECASFITKFPSLVDMESRGEDKLQKTSNYIIDEFFERLQNRFLRFCDEANPFQLLTTLLAKVFMSQIRIRVLQALKRHQKISTTSTGISHQISALHGEMLLIWHTDVVETTNEMFETSALQQYIWFVHTLFPYESLVYILKVIQSGIKSNEVERAWSAVDVILNHFAGADWLPCGSANKDMYVAMGRLAIKAWHARTSACLPDGMFSFRWVGVLSRKLGMNQQENDMAQAEDVPGVDIPGDTNPLDHFCPTGEATGGESMEIGWDYWTEFIGPL